MKADKEKKDKEEKHRIEAILKQEKKDLEAREAREREEAEKKLKEAERHKKQKEVEEKLLREKELKEKEIIKRQKEEEAEQKKLEEQIKAQKDPKGNKKYAKDIDDFLEDFEEPADDEFEPKSKKQVTSKPKDQSTNKEQMPQPGDDPELEGAVTKIQAAFRGKKDREKITDIKKTKEERERERKEREAKERNRNEEEKKERERKEFEAAKAAEKKELEELANAPGMDNAAVKIQASFRGNQDRKKFEEEKERKKKEDETKKKAEEAAKAAEKKELEELANAPGMDNAAVKIQAAYRGKQDRKKLENIRQSDPAKFENDKADKNKPVPPKSDAFDDDDEFDFLDESKPKEGGQGRREESLNHQQKSNTNQKEELEELANAPGMDKAAVKIQSTFRGKKDREKIEEIKKSRDQVKSNSNTKPNPETQPSKQHIHNLDDYDFDDEFGALNDKEESGKQEAGRDARGIDNGLAGNNQKSEADDLDELANAPGMDQAALKIQASFRGKQDRKRIDDLRREKEQLEKARDNRGKDDHRKNLPSITVTPEATAKNITEQKPEKKDYDIDTLDNDPEAGKAATKIQASFRGKQDRAKVEKLKEDKLRAEREARKIKEQEEMQRKRDEERRFKEQEAERERAAVKIQSMYRGKKDRDEIVKMKVSNKPVNQISYKEAFEAKHSKEREEAARRIQAVYRGNKERERVVKLRNQQPNQSKARKESSTHRLEPSQELNFNDDVEEELIPGKVEIIIDQLFINEVIDLQEDYAISVLVKAGNHSRLLLTFRVQDKLHRESTAHKHARRTVRF